MKYSKIVLILMLITTVAYTTFRYKADEQASNEFVGLVLGNYSQRLESAFTTAANITVFLTKILEQSSGELSEEDFQRIAAAAYDPVIHKSISYIPDGIITYTYPYEENKGAIGLNVLNGDSSGINNASRAQASGNVVLSGPNNLAQGGNGLIARNPVFVQKDGKDVFWGFISVVLNTTEVLDTYARVKDLEDISYAFSIRTVYSNQEIYVQESEEFDISKAILNEFDFGGNKWEFFLYDTKGEATLLKYAASLLFLGFAVSTLVYIILVQVEQSQKRIRDELVRDSLTKLYNRKILEQYQDLTIPRFKKGCTLFFIDLNKFKPVNDNLGHEIGDQLLIAYAGRLVAIFRKDTTVIRMGGDEFAVIIDATLNEDSITRITTDIKDLSERMFNLSGHEVYISASIGIAKYPEHGEDITALLEHADKMMYDAKAAKGEAR